jgi:hypothetical protein
MADLIFNVVKAPVGWVVHLDFVRIGGVYGTKEAAFEGRDGRGVLRCSRWRRRPY